MLVTYINMQKLHPYIRSISLLVAIVTTGFVIFICELKIIYVFVCKYADFAYFYCMCFFPEARIFYCICLLCPHLVLLLIIRQIQVLVVGVFDLLEHMHVLGY